MIVVVRYNMTLCKLTEKLLKTSKMTSSNHSPALSFRLLEVLRENSQGLLLHEKSVQRIAWNLKRTVVCVEMQRATTVGCFI